MKRLLVIQCLLFLFTSGLTTGNNSIFVSAKTTPPVELILRRTTQEGREVISRPRTTVDVGHHLPQQPHRKLFWGWVFLANVIHCPPFGKKHDDCKNGSWSRGSSSNNEGSSSGGGQDDDSGGGGDVDSDNSSSSSSYLESKSEGRSTESTTGNHTNETVLVGNSMKAVRLAMLIAAGMAFGLAIGAVLLGQRRMMRGKHSLSGSVARRMVLFGHLCTSQNFRCDRPPRHTTMSMDDYERMSESSSSSPLQSSLPQSANV